MSSTYFAYHLTHLFGPFSLESYHTNSKKPREGDKVYVISGNEVEEAGKDYFLEGLFVVHRRISGRFLLRSQKGEIKNFDFRLHLRPLRVPDAPVDLRIADWYERKKMHNFFSSSQNFNPLPVGYTERFQEVLAGYGLSSDVAQDLAEIEGRSDIAATMRDTLGKARVGQGKFRADLARLWGVGEKCSLTGIDVPELLVASHIKPWRDSADSERLDPRNGLLLASHADKLFDRYLMSFKPTTTEAECVLNPRVIEVANLLGIKQGMTLKSARIGISDTAILKNYLAGHFDRFNNRLKNETPADER
jgi:hypothetical protein